MNDLWRDAQALRALIEKAGQSEDRDKSASRALVPPYRRDRTA